MDKVIKIRAHCAGAGWATTNFKYHKIGSTGRLKEVKNVKSPRNNRCQKGLFKGYSRKCFRGR